MSKDNATASRAAYTMGDISASMTEEKRRSDGTVTRFLLRPLSYPVALAALNLNISPNAVTYFSAFCCIAALALVCTTDIRLHITAAILFIVFGVLDCADGNMARTLARKNGRKNLYGAPVDAAGGYIAYTAQILAMGLSAYRFAPDSRAEWITLAAFAASANILMRLFHQSFKNAELSAGLEVKPGKEKRFSEETGVTGFMPLLYTAALALPSANPGIPPLLPAVLSVYAVIYCGGFAVTSCKLAKKASAASTSEPQGEK